MRYWKCIIGSNDFYPERIYETNDKKINYRDELGYFWIGREIDDLPSSYGKFEEVTRRDYLFQLENEGKLKFNEQDFVNGDLAVKLNGYCDFSEKLIKICNKNKLRNGWNFDGDDKYCVVDKEIRYWNNIPNLPTVVINENPKEKEEKENKKEMREFEVGDRVKIIKNLNGHHFKIGEEVDIITDDHMDSNLPYECRGEDGLWWVNEKEIELINDPKFELNISSKDGVTSCTYKLNGKLKKNESVKLYYKDTFNVETAVEEVLKKVFAKAPHEIFELKVEKELGHKPSNEELIEAYRKEIK